MKPYYSLNKEKIFFAFKFCFIAFLVLLSAIYFTKFSDYPGLFYKVLLHLSLSLVIALFVTGLIFISGYFPFVLQRRLFENEQVNRLFNKYNFKTDFIFNENKWQLTQEVMTGIINLTSIAIFRSQAKRKAVDALVEFNFQNSDTAKILMLKKEFMETGITLGNGWARQTFSDLNNLETKILDFISLLKSKGVKLK